MALFGGAAVIGPMLVMTLHPSRNTSRITVSLATFLFALLLAIVAKDSAGKDVLAATAAYAAVLIVFVGTSMAPSSWWRVYLFSMHKRERGRGRGRERSDLLTLLKTQFSARKRQRFRWMQVLYRYIFFWLFKERGFGRNHFRSVTS